MNTQNGNILRVLTVGLICLLTVALGLFWGRKLCRVGLAVFSGRGLYEEDLGIINTMDLIYDYEIESDPNLMSPSYVSASVEADIFLGGDLGIWQEYEMEIMNYSVRNELTYEKNRVVFLDRKEGLYVYCSIFGSFNQPEKIKIQEIIAYAGPKGVSTQPDKGLGRFVESVACVVCDEEYYNPVYLLAYDSEQSCFIRIDFAERTVRQGPKMPADSVYKPVQIGKISKHGYINIYWMRPRYKSLDLEGTAHPQTVRLLKSISRDFSWSGPDFQPVLDAGGEIYKLDTERLEITGRLGHLSMPQSRYALSQVAAPEELLDYEISPLFIQGQYRGLFVATINRQLSRQNLAVFDARGREINNTNTSLNQRVFTQAFGPLFQINRYMLELLHPPILELATVLTADIIKVEEGYRGIFLLPNAFFAGYGTQDDALGLRIAMTVVMLLPGFLLAGILSQRVARDAREGGFSRWAVRGWIIGTLAFGLVGYITYRLARPTERQVTCRNCGKLRRPDMELCHRCGAEWEKAELVAPNWRVLEETD